MWGGIFIATLSTVAAGIFSIITSVLVPWSIVPLKGLGRGVGTGPPGVGIIIM